MKLKSLGLVFSLGLATCASLFAKGPAWETGIVLSQSLDSMPVGAIGHSSTSLSMSGQSVGPMFTAEGSAHTHSMSATVFGRWNTIEIETSDYRFRMEELPTGLRRLSPMKRGPANPLIVPVGQQISFYREKGEFVLLDTQGRKHWFVILGMTSEKGGVYVPEDDSAAGHFAAGERLMAQAQFLDALLEYRIALEMEPLNPTIRDREKEAEAQVAAHGR